jgi:protein involved in polysaccharide export with SLBB domain
MTEGGVLSPNIPLQAGDILAVPRAERVKYYVLGAVEKAGVFDVPAGNTVRVSQAIAWAGGPEKTARTSKGVLVRHAEGWIDKRAARRFRGYIEREEARHRRGSE